MVWNGQPSFSMSPYPQMWRADYTKPSFPVEVTLPLLSKEFSLRLRKVLN